MSGAMRNAPCPCGSGKKAKKCCMLTGKLGRVEGVSGLVPKASREEITKRVVIVSIVSVILGIAVGVMREDLALGVAVGAMVLIVSAAVSIFMKPPPPNPNSGDPAGLNFGN